MSVCRGETSVTDQFTASHETDGIDLGRDDSGEMDRQHITGVGETLLSLLCPL